MGDVDLSPACPTGVGRGMWDLGFLKDDDSRPTNPKVRILLDNPNFGATPQATSDLERGVVDQRLIATLEVLTNGHRICIETFKEGHYFLPGVPDGPRIPEGYGKAGGLPNTHYYGKAVDIRWIDGKSVEVNATDPDVLEVGRMIAGIPPKRRAVQMIGPPDWSKAIDYGRDEGCVLVSNQQKLHKVDIHFGYK